MRLLIALLPLLFPLHHAKICPTTDVRSDLDELSKLRNCTVIRGNLVIVLLESANAVQFEKYTFPELREISGYFLMMRVFGIRSLGRLFPNLSVIRGRQLLGDYAFVLFELLDLEEVGLLLKELLYGEGQSYCSGTRSNPGTSNFANFNPCCNR